MPLQFFADDPPKNGIKRLQSARNELTQGVVYERLIVPAASSVYLLAKPI